MQKKNCKLIEVEFKWSDEDRVQYDKAAIGVWDGKSNDEDIFFWFETENSVIGDHGDFEVLSYKTV